MLPILLYPPFVDNSGKYLYQFVADHLKQLGIGAQITFNPEDESLEKFGFLISHGPVSKNVRSRIQCIAGKHLPRPVTLGYLETAGFPLMNWSKAANKESVLGLFDVWDTEEILLKRSFTANSRGVLFLDRNSVKGFEWQTDSDVFCKNVNSSDFDELFKAEVFDGNILDAWTRKVTRETNRKYPYKLPEFSADIRESYQFTASEEKQIRACSKHLTSLGLGYCSLDMMRSDTGKLMAVEVNTFSVATWWSSKRLGVKERYAEAIFRFIESSATI